MRAGLARLSAAFRESDAPLVSDQDLRAGLGRLRAAIAEKRRAGEWINTYVNAFDVMGRPRLEAAITYTLAWLLNPEESHGLGDQVLRQVLQHASRGRRLRTGGVTVECEVPFALGRFDISVCGPGWRLVIENKVDSWESDSQTPRYAEELRRSGGVPLGIFLTPRGTAPQDTEIFRALSYRKLREFVLAAQPSDSRAVDAEVLVQHFCDHILHHLR